MWKCGMLCEVSYSAIIPSATFRRTGAVKAMRNNYQRYLRQLEWSNNYLANKNKVL